MTQSSMFAFANILTTLGYSSREVACLLWVEDTPVLKHMFDFLASQYSFLTDEECALLSEVPQEIRDMSSEDLDKLLMEFNTERLSSDVSAGRRADDIIQGSIPFMEELSQELTYQSPLDVLPDLTGELERLRAEIKQVTNAVKDTSDQLHTSTTFIHQFFSGDVAECDKGAEALEAYVRGEDALAQTLVATAREIGDSITSILYDVHKYAEECVVAVEQHKHAMADAFHGRVNHLLTFSRLHKLSETLPEYTRGKYLPPFPAALEEFVSVYKQYKVLYESCTKLTAKVICCPEAIEQKANAETLIQKCYGVYSRGLDALLETVSDAFEREKDGLRYANQTHKLTSSIMDALDDLLVPLERIQKEHIVPEAAALQLVQRAKSDISLSPTAALGYQTTISALAGTPIRGVAQLADTLLLASQKILPSTGETIIDLAEPLNELIDGQISKTALFSTQRNKSVHTNLFDRLRDAIAKVQEFLESSSSSLPP